MNFLLLIKGGDWSVRISGMQSHGDEKITAKLSLMFYLGVDNPKSGSIKLDTSQPGKQRVEFM